jgi:hypothetical protein
MDRKEYKKQWHLNNKQRKKQYKIDNNICYDCDAKTIANKKRCALHLKGNTDGVKRWTKNTENGKAHKRETNRKHAYIKRRGPKRYEYVVSKVIAKNRIWGITKEDYNRLVLQPCYYCELENNVQAGTGLDRLYNSIGYILSNVVSCCKECNIARNKNFTSDEMKIIGKAIKMVKLSRLIQTSKDNI